MESINLLCVIFIKNSLQTTTFTELYDKKEITHLFYFISTNNINACIISILCFSLLTKSVRHLTDISLAYRTRKSCLKHLVYKLQSCNVKRYE